MEVSVRFPAERPDNTVYAFCDESSQTAHRYFVVGALYFGPGDPARGEKLCEEIETRLAGQKKDYGLGDHELKWETIPNRGRYLEGYKELIGFYLEEPLVSFRCMVVDTQQYSLSSPEFTGRDQELGYRKFLCVFLADGLMKWLAEYFFVIRVDKKETRPNYTIEDLENATNLRFIKREGVKRSRYLNYCTIEEVDSKQWCTLQVADILTGAVAAKWNARVRAVGKLEMIRHIEEKLGRDLLMPTRPSETRFNIWQFQARRSIP